MKYRRNDKLSIAGIGLLMTLVTPCKAETDWISFTLDNDLFIGNDNGYTNGIYVSFFDTGDEGNALPSRDFWVSPLMWSMPAATPDAAVNAYSAGQTMSTPSDITIENPDQSELPYSALLALTNTYVAITRSHADLVATTVGIVGPAALGEESQKFVHEIINGDEPLGWDTQLENEIVFNFNRGRTWRYWVSKTGNTDILTNGQIGIGTVRSSLDAGVYVRYGRDLISSYATTLFSNSRTSNPGAVNGGWYVYAGIEAGYIFNQIFTDGNTYRDSRSIDYDSEYVGVSSGLAFSGEDWSITFAIRDANVIQSGDTEEALMDLTQYGTLTFAWQL